MDGSGYGGGRRNAWRCDSNRSQTTALLRQGFERYFSLSLCASEKWSGRRDSNSRPLAPHASALPCCATSRTLTKWHFLTVQYCHLILLLYTGAMKRSKSEQPGPWPKTSYANLIRYVPSGTYFARIRIQGKLIVKSLKTDAISVAKLRLGDLEKGERQNVELRAAAV